MHLSEYKNIFENESSHFFYVANHSLVLSIINKYFKSRKELRILDAGCGTGLLAQKMQTFGKVIGVDISREALKFTKQRHVTAIQASVTDLPFPANSFDLVVSIDVLYHQSVENTQKAVDEFYRVLKPTGILILKVPAYDWLRGNHDITVHTKHRFTTQEIKIKIKKAGFAPIKITYLASFLLPIALIKRMLERITASNIIHSDVSQPNFLVNKLLVTLFAIELQVLKIINLPFGLSILSISVKK